MTALPSPLLAALAQVPANQSSMYPTGVQAERINALFWGFTWVCTIFGSW